MRGVVNRHGEPSVVGTLSTMFAFTPTTDLQDLITKVDTARHRGVPRGCVLELNLLEMPPESAHIDPIGLALSGGSRPLSLRRTIAALYRAIDDPRVSGLIARVQIPPASAGAVQELRAAIEAFTAVKPSLAWAESYPGTLSYYLASAFSEVWMQPSGTVGLIGFAAKSTFLRGALDKAGVDTQFLTRGQYKSAANIFTKDGYTEAQREAEGRLLESLSEQVREAVAVSRKLEPEDIDKLANQAPLRRAEAVTGGLVDRIGFRDEAYARINELTGAHSAEGEPALLYLARYAKVAAAPLAPTLGKLPGRSSRPSIGVVTVSGGITSGRSGPQLLPPGPASGADVIAAGLRDAAADESISAIVLRINSPGGSVSGSETIWREVIRARAAGKPVVASMGSIAGSGGYYVAMGADVIVANPGTITGSIGVITGKFITRRLKEKLGVSSDTLRTNANADAWSSDEPFTEAQQELVETEMDMHYEDFVLRVAEGRKLPVDAVKAVAQGRIWSGRDALGHGLVDELGGFRVAVTRAKVLAGLDADTAVRIANFPSSSLVAVLRPRSSSRPAASLMDSMIGQVAQRVADTVIRTQSSLSGAQALMPGDYRF